MPATTDLAQLLLDPDRRPGVVADLSALMEEEISSTGGAMGLAVKSGYALAKKRRPNFLPNTVDSLLPEMVTALQPSYQEAQAAGVPMSRYLEEHKDEVTVRVVAAVEAYIDASDRDGMKKGYAKVRGQAPERVGALLPAIGRVIEKNQAA